jgi:cytidylate kinase
MANPTGDTATAAGVDEGEPPQERPSIPRVIAVDGSAASGKSTVGRRLAAHLRYPFLDTGIMYRAITYASTSARNRPVGRRRACTPRLIDHDECGPSTSRLGRVGDDHC